MTLTAAQQAALAVLPQFCSYRDILAALGGEDALLDHWGELPDAVRRNCEDTMSERTLEILLLRRIVRQLDALLTEVRAS